MKRLYIDCTSGVSGDMMLGAFLNLGVPQIYLKKKLDSLHLKEFSLKVEEKEIKGEPVTDVDVILKDESSYTKHPYSGQYRNYAEIKKLIKDSNLSEKEKKLSLHIFQIKAEAESKVHEVPLDEVQFHEAGAVDSVVDIVGTSICCAYVGADEVVSKHVPTGYGYVKCACGILTVPAPAVKQILKDTGIPFYRSDIPQEVLTPTGASIIAGISDGFGWETMKGQVLSTGMGAGKRYTGLPPLKLTLCEEVEKN